MPSRARGHRAVPPDRARSARSRRVVGAGVSLGGDARRGRRRVRRRARAARPFVLLGHSLGGAVAQWYLQHRPEAMSARSGLISTSPGFTVDGRHAGPVEGRRSRVPRGAARRDRVAGGRSATRAARVMAARQATTLDALHGDLDAIAGWQNPGWLDIDVPDARDDRRRRHAGDPGLRPCSGPTVSRAPHLRPSRVPGT